MASNQPFAQDSGHAYFSYMLPIIITTDADQATLLRIRAEMNAQGIRGWGYYESGGNPDFSVQRNIGISHASAALAKHALQPGGALVLESDVRFLGLGAYKAFEYKLGVLDGIDPDWDIAFAGIYAQGRRGLPSMGWMRVYGVAGMHCYVVRSNKALRAMERFAEGLAPSEAHLDRWITAPEQGLRCYVCTPFCAVQHNGFSTRLQREVNNDRHLKRYPLRVSLEEAAAHLAPFLEREQANKPLAEATQDAS